VFCWTAHIQVVDLARGRVDNKVDVQLPGERTLRIRVMGEVAPVAGTADLTVTFTSWQLQLDDLGGKKLRRRISLSLSLASQVSHSHAQLSPGGVQGWRACPHAQPGCPTRGAPPAEQHRKAAPLTYLLA